MLHRISTWLGRTGKLFRFNERGIATLDWIGLTAAILTFLTAIILWFQTAGGRMIGAAVAAAFSRQIARWQ
jgi:hypothetical protein